MSGLTVSSVQTPLSKEHWITPLEQLERLAIDEAKTRVYEVRSQLSEMPKGLIDEVIQTAARSILERSGIIEANEEGVRSVKDHCVESLIELAPLPEILTNWYKARKELNLLPEKIPPLPLHIIQIINGKCPIYGNEIFDRDNGLIESDGTSYKVKDTHVLQLLAEEDGNLNRFERGVKRYGEDHYPTGENFLQFRFFVAAARREHGARLLEPSHWELMAKDVLPGSRSQSWQNQLELIGKLSQKAFIAYEAPSLLNVTRTLFLHKVATGESLYPTANAQNGDTYTGVQETIQNLRLVVGSFGACGVDVHSHYDDGDVLSGVGALRKFS